MSKTSKRSAPKSSSSESYADGSNEDANHATRVSTLKSKRPRKEKQEITTKRHSSETVRPKESKRGQAFTESEIKTLLLAIFQGKDNAQAAEMFLLTHKGTGRSKQALKGIFFVELN